MTVWGHTVAVTKAVQQPLDLASAWTEWKSCGNGSLVWGKAFGVAGAKVGAEGRTKVVVNIFGYHNAISPIA